MRIYNYSLNDNYFSGELELTNGRRQHFSMRKVASPNWGGMRWGGSYYYSNTSTFDAGDSQTVTGEKKVENAQDTAEEMPVRIFRVKEN